MDVSQMPATVVVGPNHRKRCPKLSRRLVLRAYRANTYTRCDCNATETLNVHVFGAELDHCIRIEQRLKRRTRQDVSRGCRGADLGESGSRDVAKDASQIPCSDPCVEVNCGRGDIDIDVSGRSARCRGHQCQRSQHDAGVAPRDGCAHLATSKPAALRAATATSWSCWALPPEIPMPPTTRPSTTMGTPPPTGMTRGWLARGAVAG